MKDVVKVVFEMPREEYATLKYLCIKRKVSMKSLFREAALKFTGSNLALPPRELKLSEILSKQISTAKKTS